MVLDRFHVATEPGGISCQLTQLHHDRAFGHKPEMPSNIVGRGNCVCVSLRMVSDLREYEGHVARLALLSQHGRCKSMGDDGLAASLQRLTLSVQCQQFAVDPKLSQVRFDVAGLCCTERNGSLRLTFDRMTPSTSLCT